MNYKELHINRERKNRSTVREKEESRIPRQTERQKEGETNRHREKQTIKTLGKEGQWRD